MNDPMPRLLRTLDEIMDERISMLPPEHPARDEYNKRKTKEGKKPLLNPEMAAMHDAWANYLSQDNEGWKPARAPFKAGWFAAKRYYKRGGA